MVNEGHKKRRPQTKSATRKNSVPIAKPGYSNYRDSILKPQ